MAEREFKGVWIPKEIWLADDLKLREKAMLAEIESLETEDRGCYASNSYFGKFFNLSNNRVSEVINSLVDKKWITAEYIKEGKEIVERQLRINKFRYSENRIGGYSENVERVFGKHERDNINNNIYTTAQSEDFAESDNLNLQTPAEEGNKTDLTSEERLEHNFNILYVEYPRKVGKISAFKHYKQWIKGRKINGKTIKLTNDEMLQAILRYAERNVATDMKYIKQADTFFNNILDYVEVEE